MPSPIGHGLYGVEEHALHCRPSGVVEHGVHARGGKATSPLLEGFAADVAAVFDAPETGA